MPRGDDNIEDNLQHKVEEVRTAANLELEKKFREKYGKHNDSIYKHLDIIRSEFVIDHYACAHYGKIPKQGRLYITPHLVIFYANILGKKVKKKIPFEKIMEIKKESVTLMAVSPIEIHLKYKRFTFVSFVHRDQAYNHLMMQWKANQEGKAFDIKIPLSNNADKEGSDAEDEGEDDGLHAEPGGGLELQSMWGTAQPVIDESAPENTPSKAAGGPTLSKMPKMYGGGGGQAKKGRCSCFPCFR